MTSAIGLICRGSASRAIFWRKIMTTILIIVVVFLLLGGGGYYGFRRR